MTRERLTIPRDREAVLADYYELTSYGVAPGDAARRLDVSPEQVAVWVKSARESELRRARILVAEGAS